MSLNITDVKLYKKNMKTILTTRPRNVNSWRAAAILYGDWGTSKAYVLGLAFALASYSSFWFILAVSCLTLLVGTCYTFICKAFPNGGGVYSSVRPRSKVLALIGAFFLISDYLVTAALSALSAFHYIGLPHPEYFAMLSIGIIGCLNFLGPKHTGSLALLLAIPTVLVVVILGLFTLPFLPEAISRIKPINHDFILDWRVFVGVIVALSGIESIANTTSSMKLDKGSSYAKPSVVKTSTPAILMVMAEVCIFTTLFGLAMNALPGLEINNQDVTAPGYPNVRDAMLRYMGESFAGSLFGTSFGYFFGIVVMIVIALILLSAVNTALIALISLLFIMSRDEELPTFFQKLNRFGDPIYATLIAFLIPIFILMVVNDIAGMANLYAIGFVGAITVNLIATATNFTLPLKSFQRALMLFTFVIMFLIEVTLFIDKPDARVFVISITAIGLLLRALARERKEKVVVDSVERPTLPKMPEGLMKGILVAVKDDNKSLDYAFEEAENINTPLYILFVREQRVVTEQDSDRRWSEDSIAIKVYDKILAKNLNKRPIEFLYTITASTAHSIIEIAEQKNVSRVIVQKERKFFTLANAIRGVTIRDLTQQMPSDIDLVVIF